MPSRSARSSSRRALSSPLFLVSLQANAELTVTPVSPYVVDGSSVVYYGGCGSDASGLVSGGFPDVAAGYTVYSLGTAAAADPSRAQMLLFDVKSNANFDETQTIVVSVFAKDTAGDNQAVPIAAAEETTDTPSAWAPGARRPGGRTRGRGVS